MADVHMSAAPTSGASNTSNTMSLPLTEENKKSEKLEGKLSSIPEAAASTSSGLFGCSSTEGDYSSNSSAPLSPSQNGPDSQSFTSVKDCVLKMMDEMDERVDKLRSEAMKLENERDDILSSLDRLSNAQMVYELEGIDLDEVTRYLDRITRRCISIQVEIKTERSPQQLDALSKVNTLIDALIGDLKNDVAAARRRCVSYINSCSENVSQDAPYIDAKFESAVLGCTGDDQKRIKKRLTGLYSYFSSVGMSDRSGSNSQGLGETSSSCGIDRPLG